MDDGDEAGTTPRWDEVGERFTQLGRTLQQRWSEGRSDATAANEAAAEEVRGAVDGVKASLDDLADTIAPRLDKAGADDTKIIAVEGIKVESAGGYKPSRMYFSLEHHLPQLEQALADWPAVRLIVIDPISAYCGQTDSHNNAEVRALLAPLADLAGRCQQPEQAATIAGRCAVDGAPRLHGFEGGAIAWHRRPGQASARSSTAMRTATPFATCRRISDCGPSATASLISTPRFIGPGCMTIASGLAKQRRSAVMP